MIKFKKLLLRLLITAVYWYELPLELLLTVSRSYCSSFVLCTLSDGVHLYVGVLKRAPVLNITCGM